MWWILLHFMKTSLVWWRQICFSYSRNPVLTTVKLLFNCEFRPTQWLCHTLLQAYISHQEELQIQQCAYIPKSQRFVSQRAAIFCYPSPVRHYSAYYEPNQTAVWFFLHIKTSAFARRSHVLLCFPIFFLSFYIQTEKSECVCTYRAEFWGVMTKLKMCRWKATMATELW